MESVRKLFDRTTSYQIMKECEILEEGWFGISSTYLCVTLIRNVLSKHSQLKGKWTHESRDKFDQQLLKCCHGSYYNC